MTTFARCLLVLASLQIRTVSAQQWVAEWFVDVDPGAGSANRTTFDPNDPGFQLPISTQGMSPGAHVVGFRIADQQFDAGLVDHKHWWSTTEIRHIYVLPKIDPRESLLGTAPIVGGEWFVGRDPGTGKGSALSWAKTDSVQDWYGLSFGKLPEGLSTVGVRVKDSLGRWSSTRFRTFAVVAGAQMPYESSAPIVGGEWFVGRDPGTGKGSALSWAKTDSVHDWRSISFRGLPRGLNTVGVRVKDSLGRWSSTQFRTFAVVAGGGIFPDTSAPLVGGEWYFDRDPGTGRGTAFTFEPTDSLATRLSVAAKGLPLGAHQIGLRVRDALGRWSNAKSAAFQVVRGPSARDTTLTSLEDSAQRFGSLVFPWSSDVAGDTLQQVVIHALPSGGALSIGGTPVVAGDRIGVDRLRRGDLVYLPAKDANGRPLDSLKFAVVVDSLISDIAGVRLHVLPVNDAPSAVAANRPDTAWVNQSWTLRWSGTDVDGDSLRLVSRGLPSWMKPGADGRSLVGTPGLADASANPVPLVLWVTDGTDSVVLPAAPIVVAARIATSVGERPVRRATSVPGAFALVRPVVEEPVDGGGTGEIRRVPKGAPECRGPRLPLAVGDRVDIAIWDRLGVPVLEWSASDLPSGELWLDWNLRSSKGIAVPSGVYIWEIRVKNVRTGDSRREYLMQGVKRP